MIRVRPYESLLQGSLLPSTRPSLWIGSHEVRSLPVWYFVGGFESHLSKFIKLNHRGAYADRDHHPTKMKYNEFYGINQWTNWLGPWWHITRNSLSSWRVRAFINLCLSTVVGTDQIWWWLVWYSLVKWITLSLHCQCQILGAFEMKVITMREIDG